MDKPQTTEETRGTLKLGEYHPSADSAADYIRSLVFTKLHVYQEALASCAIEGNRLAEICFETLDRFLNGKQVSDRYLLGLSWFLKEMDEKECEDQLAVEIENAKAYRESYEKMKEHDGYNQGIRDCIDIVNSYHTNSLQEAKVKMRGLLRNKNDKP